MEICENCRFCKIVGGQYKYAGIDEPFASNDKFVAVASIGALIEGWTLIVPKTHHLSMRNVYGSFEFSSIVGAVLPPLIHQYGSLIAFEHGANKEGSITGCGVDHAHLHLVPMDESLLPDIQHSGLKWVRCHASVISSMTGKSEYLFYTELNENKVWQDPMGFLHVLENPLSQFFRRLIASRRGGVKVSDYKRFPYLNTAMQTRSVLANSVA